MKPVPAESSFDVVVVFFDFEMDLRSVGERRGSKVRVDVELKMRLVVEFLNRCGGCSFGEWEG